MTFNNFFFNVANWDNGRTWSTQWVIDDPKVFVIPPEGQTVAQLVPREEAAAAAAAGHAESHATAARQCAEPPQIEQSDRELASASTSRGASAAVKCGDGRTALGILDRRRWHVHRLPGEAPGRLDSPAQAAQLRRDERPRRPPVRRGMRSSIRRGVDDPADFWTGWQLVDPRSRPASRSMRRRSSGLTRATGRLRLSGLNRRAYLPAPRTSCAATKKRQSSRFAICLACRCISRFHQCRCGWGRRAAQTPSSRAAVRERRSSPRAASATCWKSATRPGRDCSI